MALSTSAERRGAHTHTHTHQHIPLHHASFRSRNGPCPFAKAKPSAEIPVRSGAVPPGHVTPLLALPVPPASAQLRREPCAGVRAASALGRSHLVPLVSSHHRIRPQTASSRAWPFGAHPTARQHRKHCIFSITVQWVDEKMHSTYHTHFVLCFGLPLSCAPSPPIAMLRSCLCVLAPSLVGRATCNLDSIWSRGAVGGPKHGTIPGHATTTLQSGGRGGRSLPTSKNPFKLTCVPAYVHLLLPPQ